MAPGTGGGQQVGGKKANKGGNTSKRKAAVAEETAQRRVGCPVLLESGCRIGEPVDPKNPGDAVKMICQNPKCEYSPFIHRRCYDAWEDLLVTVMATTSWSRSWTDAQRRSNLWDKKGYQLIGKMCRCLCDKGHVRRDLDYKPPVGEEVVVKKKVTKPQSKKDLPTLKNPDFKSGFIGKQLPNVSSSSFPSTSSSITYVPLHQYTPVAANPPSQRANQGETSATVHQETTQFTSPQTVPPSFPSVPSTDVPPAPPEPIASRSPSSGLDDGSVESLKSAHEIEASIEETVNTCAQYLVPQQIPYQEPVENEYWQGDGSCEYVNRPLHFYNSSTAPSARFIPPPPAFPAGFLRQFWQPSPAPMPMLQPMFCFREYQLFNGPSLEDLFRRELPNVYNGTGRRFEATNVFGDAVYSVFSSAERALST